MKIITNLLSILITTITIVTPTIDNLLYESYQNIDTTTFFVVGLTAFMAAILLGYAQYTPQYETNNDFTGTDLGIGKMFAMWANYLPSFHLVAFITVGFFVK